MNKSRFVCLVLTMMVLFAGALFGNPLDGIYSDDEQVKSVTHSVDLNVIEVVKVRQAVDVYAVVGGSPSSDKVWKEVYGVIEGKIELLQVIEGRHVPPSINDGFYEFSFSN